MDDNAIRIGILQDSYLDVVRELPLHTDEYVADPYLGLSMEKYVN